VTTVAIIGAGDLGGAVAQALAAREATARLVLIDDAASAAAGKALDIQQMGAISGWHTRLRGSADMAEAIGCAVCVVADRFGSSEWQGEEGRAMLSTLARTAGDAPLVLAGASQTELLGRAVRDAGCKPHRVVGSSTEAFASSVRAIVALEARCAPAEVMLSVLGVPPELVVAWSEATIGGFALARVLSPVQLGHVQATSARLWPPRPFNLGLAAATVAEGIIRSARRTFNVLTVLDGEHGARGRVGAVPAFLNQGGIAATRTPSLSTRERVLVDTAIGT
jgi:malate dehydrogenase